MCGILEKMKLATNGILDPFRTLCNKKVPVILSPPCRFAN